MPKEFPIVLDYVASTGQLEGRLGVQGCSVFGLGFWDVDFFGQ